MNTQLMPSQPAPRYAKRRAKRALASDRPVALRSANAGDAPALYALIQAHLEEGRLLPRDPGELSVHAHRFVVATRRGRIVGCAELAPLSGRVAEVRSLVVARRARSQGIGARLVAELRERARRAGFEQLCAFAHDAAFFARSGFSIVPHTWLPEKIARDCTACPQFRRCGQHALVTTLADHRQSRPAPFVPLAALRS